MRTLVNYYTFHAKLIRFMGKNGVVKTSTDQKILIFVFHKTLSLNFPLQCQYEITPNGVGPFFCSPLGIDRILDIAALTKDVAADETGKHLSLEERIGQLGIPDEFVDVHVVVLKTTVGIHGDVRGGLPFEWEGAEAITAVLNAEDVVN